MAKFEKPKLFSRKKETRSSSSKKVSPIVLGALIFLSLAAFGLYKFGADLVIGFVDLITPNGEEGVLETGRDNLPPPPPQLDPLPEATNSASLAISGQAEAGAELVLFQNGEEKEKTKVNEEGDFIFSQVELEEGENIFLARAYDEAGNESQASLAQTVIFDKEPPALEIESPGDGQTINDNKEIIIKGKTEKEAVVTVNERQVIVGLEGNFEADYFLTEGDNEIIVVAKDKAGNKTEKTIKVKYQP